MQKLITAYRIAPPDTNKAKLQAYVRKHSMAICLLMPAEIQYLKNIGINI